MEDISILDCYECLRTFSNQKELDKSTQLLCNLYSRKDGLITLFQVFETTNDEFFTKQAMIGIKNCFYNVVNTLEDNDLTFIQSRLLKIIINYDSYFLQVEAALILKTIIGITDHSWEELDAYIQSPIINRIYFFILRVYIHSVISVQNVIEMMDFLKLVINDGFQSDDLLTNVNIFLLIASISQITHDASIVTLFNEEIHNLLDFAFLTDDLLTFQYFMGALKASLSILPDLINVFDLIKFNNLKEPFLLEISDFFCYFLEQWQGNISIDKILQLLQFQVELCIKLFQVEYDEYAFTEENMCVVLLRMPEEIGKSKIIQYVQTLTQDESHENLCTVIVLITAYIIQYGELPSSIDYFILCLKSNSLTLRKNAISYLLEVNQIIWKSIEYHYSEIIHVLCEWAMEYVPDGFDRRESTIYPLSALVRLIFPYSDLNEIIDLIFQMCSYFIENGYEEEIVNCIFILSAAISTRPDKFYESSQQIINMLLLNISVSNKSIIRESMLSCLISALQVLKSTFIEFLDTSITVLEICLKYEDDNASLFLSNLVNIFPLKMKEFALSWVDILFASISQPEKIGLYKMASILESLAVIIITYQEFCFLDMFIQSFLLLLQQSDINCIRSSKRIIRILNHNLAPYQLVIMKLLLNHLSNKVEIFDVADEILKIVGFSADFLPFVNDSIISLQNIVFQQSPGNSCELTSFIQSCLELSNGSFPALAQHVYGFSSCVINDDKDFVRHMSIVLLTTCIQYYPSVVQIDVIYPIMVHILENDDSICSSDAAFFFSKLSNYTDTSDLIPLIKVKMESIDINKTDDLILHDHLVLLLISIYANGSKRKVSLGDILNYFPILTDENMFNEVYSFIIDNMATINQDISLVELVIQKICIFLSLDVRSLLDNGFIDPQNLMHLFVLVSQHINEDQTYLQQLFSNDQKQYQMFLTNSLLIQQLQSESFNSVSHE